MWQTVYIVGAHVGYNNNIIPLHTLGPWCDGHFTSISTYRV